MLRATASLYQIADAVWSLIALANRTVNVVKNIQHGSTTIPDVDTSATSAITSVDTAKAFLVVRQADALGGAPVRAEITNATTVTASKGGTAAAGTVYWTVVEYQ